jgi:hypothetical protein
MDDDNYGSYGGEPGAMVPPRGVAVPQPQGVNPVQILAQELQKTQAEVAQMKQIVIKLVEFAQAMESQVRPPQGPPQGGMPPQMQPGMPQGQPDMPRQ